MIIKPEDSLCIVEIDEKGEKSAEILVKTLSMTGTKRQTITTDNLRQLAKDFGVTLPKKFL